MGRVWKRASDQGKPGVPWYITYTDWEVVDGKWRSRERSIKAVLDKYQSQKLSEKLEDKARMRMRGLSNDEDDAMAPTEGARDDYLAYLRSKGSTESHVKDVHATLARVCVVCGWSVVGNITAKSFVVYLNGLGAAGGSARTLNKVRGATRSFSAWLVRRRTLRFDPLIDVPRRREAGARRLVRRALLPEEISVLLRETAIGPDWQIFNKGSRRLKGTVPGRERAMLYRVAMGTGFRANELRSLWPESFNLMAARPTITVQAGCSKRRRRDVQPIAHNLATALRDFLDGRPPGQPVFNVVHTTAVMLRSDLEGARAKWIASSPDEQSKEQRTKSDFLKEHDARGAVVDFHALRMTFITELARAGVHPGVAQKLARHSTIRLTMDCYTDVIDSDADSAIAMLPERTL